MHLQEEPKFFRSSWWGLILFAVALISRLLFLSSNPLSLDEPFSVYFSQMSFSEMTDKLNTENNPPLFYFLLHCWMKVFGYSEFSVRFLPAMFSAFIVPLAYKLGQTFFSWRVGLISAVFFLVSESQIEFAHDCRAYSLLCLLTLALFYLTLLMHQTDQKNKHWIAFIFLNSALLYTHFIGWVVVFLIFVMNLLLAKPTTRKKYLLFYLLVLVLVLPYLSVFKERLFSSASHPVWQKTPHVIDLYNRFVSFFNKPLVAVCSLILIAIGLFLQINSATKMSLAEKCTALGFALSYYGLFVLSYRFPVFMERYLLVCSIPIYFLLANSLERIWLKKNQAAILYLFCIALMVFTTNLNPTRSKPSNKIVELLNKLKQNKQTALVINPEWYESTFLYYYDSKLFHNYHQAKLDLAERGIFSINEFNSIWVKERLKNYSKLIYFQSNSDLVDVTNRNLELLGTTHKCLSSFEIYNCKFSILAQLEKKVAREF